MTTIFLFFCRYQKRVNEDPENAVFSVHAARGTSPCASPSSRCSGPLKIDHAYSEPTESCTATTGGSAIQRLKPSGAIDASGSAERLLDTLEVEQDRGITVKAMHASLVYTCTRREQEAAEVRNLGRN